MNKKNILTTAGMLLSFTIAIGGWILISKLIDMESKRLLSHTLHVTTNTLETPPANPTNNSDDVPDDESAIPLARPYLTTDEIAAVLWNWDSPGVEMPHEPTSEQLNMEQAIEAGKEYLSFINELTIFPDKSLQFIKAYLFQNLPPGEYGQFLSPEYSYWKVAFANETMSIDMVINAVTGQVWKIEIDLLQYTVELNDTDILNALTEFSAFLDTDLSDGGIILSSNPLLNSLGQESMNYSSNFSGEKVQAEIIVTGQRLPDYRWLVENFVMKLNSLNSSEMINVLESYE